MKTLVLLTSLLFIMSQVIAAPIDPRTNLPDTTMGVPIEEDHHCVCKRMTNSTGKNLFIGWRTATEWASFYNSPPTNVTAANCMAAPGHPTITLPASYTDTSTDKCSINTDTFDITNVLNSGGYNLRVTVPAAYFSHPAGCTASYMYSNGGGAYLSQALVAGQQTLNVCHGSRGYLYFTCGNELNHGPYTITISRSDSVTLIDSFTIQFYFYGTFPECGAFM